MPQSEDDAIGLCTDCGTEQSDAHMFNSPFAQAGKNAVCKYCRGVVIVCYRSQKKEVLDKINRDRGIQ
jgi:hypothetical protein